MPLFDVAEPHDTDVAGLGAKAIRDEIKTVFNTKLETKAIEIIDADWECIKGWPRIYYAASGAPPAPPANADQGRLWFVSDLFELRAHDGTNWIRLSPPMDVRIPLFYGPGQRLINAAYGGSINSAGLYYNATGGTWLNANWVGATGIPFNKANAPYGATIKLAVVGGADVAGQAKVKLYDVGAAADVAGSEVTLAGGALTAAEAVSGDLAAAITAGNRLLGVMSKAGTATYYNLVAAYLVIQKA